MSPFITSGGQSIGVSASTSVLPVNIQDWLDLLAVQRTLKSLLQHHSLKASILRCSTFFIVQLSHPYMTTGKTIALTRWTFVPVMYYLRVCVCVCVCVSCPVIPDSEITWTIALQAPLSIEFSSQEYWSE